mgnify:CR=1 FL=1
MIKKHHLVLLFAFAIQSVFSQADGYWEKDRVTSREINVNAREIGIVKSEDLPVGTTEIG